MTTITPAVSNSPSTLTVFQKECYLSNGKKIATGSFGPCYVFTAYDPQSKYSILAHIDDTTQIESISQIFQKLRELDIAPANLTKMKLMGGWKQNRSSAEWGERILLKFKEEGISSDKIDLTHFQQKKAVFRPITPNEMGTYYYNGGVLDPSSGDFQFFVNPWTKLEKLQLQKTGELQASIQEKAQLMTKDPIEMLSLMQKFAAEEFPLAVTVEPSALVSMPSSASEELSGAAMTSSITSLPSKESNKRTPVLRHQIME